VLNHVAKVIPFATPDSSRRSQPIATAPLKPTRDQIIDLILDGWSFQEVAIKSRTSLSTVYAVNVAWMEQYMRQATAGKLQAESWLVERYREIETEVWAEYGPRRNAA
jgi:DNA-binding NarL/FixJ family response regulator